jgi:chorismate mutase
VSTATSVTTNTTPAPPDHPATSEAITISHNSALPRQDKSRGEQPEGEKSIADMRVEIDEIDAELVRLIQRRSEISHAIGAARAAEGGTRIVYSREMKVLDRFAVLGPAGTELGMLLLSLGRGQLGRR